MVNLFEDFLRFLQDGTTPWHVAREIGNRLALQSFTPLSKEEKWKLKKGQKYFVQKGASTIAFKMPEKKPTKCIILGSHVDSPSIMIKPRGIFQEKNIVLCTTEIYGGANQHSWFDRDLIIAGKVTIIDENNELTEHLICLDDAPVIIPSLATHLGKKEEAFNPQEHLRPILGLLEPGETAEDFLPNLIKHHVFYKSLLSFDLCLVPREKPSFLGKKGEFLASSKIDK